MDNIIKEALMDEETRKLIVDMTRDAVWGRLKTAVWVVVGIGGTVYSAVKLGLSIKDDIAEARRRKNVRKDSVDDEQNTDGE